MKFIKRGALIVLSVLLLAALCALAACTDPEDPKETGTLVLDAGEGGTLAESEFTVEVDTPLTGFLSGKTPTAADGLTFAGWYDAKGDAIADDATMPEDTLTLFAKYTAEYTVTLSVEQGDGSFTDENATGTAFFGEPFTYQPERAHYEVDPDAENRLSTDKLGAHEHFTARLLFERYSVVYYVNSPDKDIEVSGSIPTEKVRYGETVTVADGSVLDAGSDYRFAGWSFTGEEPDAAYAPGTEISPEANVYLRAVWDKAYPDRYGGVDRLFVLRTAENKVILRRPGVGEFEGTLGENGIFTVPGMAYTGRINSNGTFTYVREAQAGTYLHLDAYTGELAEDGATIELDAYDGAVYRDGNETVTGSYDLDGDLYRFYFPDSAEGFEFYVREYESADGPISVYVRQGAETGSYLGFRLAGAAGIDSEYDDILVLDGFGNAGVYDVADLVLEDTATLVEAGTYRPVGDSEAELLLTDGTSAYRRLRVLLATYNDSPAWFAYHEEAAGEYTSEAGTLVLDGYGYSMTSASLTPAGGGRSTGGMYVVEESFFGTVVRLTSGTGDYSVTTTYLLEGRTFREVGGADYGEYLMLGEDGNAAAPLLVLDGRGGAELWNSGTLLARGKTETADGRFRYTQTELIDETAEVPTMFAFDLRTTQFTDGVHTVYTVYDATRVVTLTGEDGTLSYDNYGFAHYVTAGGETYEGRYFIVGENPHFTIGFSVMEFYTLTDGTYLYFRFDAAAHTFKRLSDDIGSYGEYFNDFELDTENAGTVFLSGDEFAAYLTQDGAATTGTYQKKNGVYVFTSDAFTFEFMLVDYEGEAYFLRRTERWDGKLVLRDAGGSPVTLTLDGFCTATDSNGAEGNYLLLGTRGDDNLLRVYVSDGTGDAYFDIDIDKALYREVGYEVGEYYVYADGEYGSSLLDLDGYGKATLYDITSGDYVLSKEGTYRITDLEELSLEVTFAEETPQEASLRYIETDEGGDRIVIFELALAGTYTSTARELLEIGTFGDGAYIDGYGIRRAGSVAILGENIARFRYDGGEFFFALTGKTFTIETEGYLASATTLYKYLGGLGKDLTVPAGITYIAAEAFTTPDRGSLYNGSDIESIDLGGVTRIGMHAFHGCTALTRVTGNKVEEVGAYAFYGCIELTTLEMQEARFIGDFAFWRCEELDAVGFDKATYIGAGAFGLCYDLASVDLPAAVTVCNGAFLDTFSLASITFGAGLETLGSATDTTGIFERTPGEADEVPLVVTFEGDTMPVFGTSIFRGVLEYTLCVKGLDVLLSFYTDEALSPYADRAGIASLADGSYSRVSNSSFVALELKIVARYEDRSGGVRTLGAYTIDADSGDITFYAYAPETTEGYRSAVLARRTADGLLFDADDYGLQFVSDWTVFYGPDREYEIKVWGQETEQIAFRYTGGTQFDVPAVYTDRDGGAHDVRLVAYRDVNDGLMTYFDLDGYRYVFDTVYGNGLPTAFEYRTPAFVPVVTRYGAADGSYLALSQEDAAATRYTLSALLSGVTGHTEFRIERAEAEKTAENTFTAEAEVGGIRYTFTFVLDGDGFTYTYRGEGVTELTSADGTYKLTVTQDETGLVTDLLLSEYYDPGYGDGSADWRALGDAFFRLRGGVYFYYVYGSLAARYEIRLTMSGDTVSAFTVSESGKVVNGFYQGDSVYVYLGEDGSFDELALWLRDSEGRNHYVAYASVSQENGCTVTVEGTFANEYFVGWNDTGATLVRRFSTYVGEADAGRGYAAGTLKVERDRSGAIVSMTLTVGALSLTEFTELAYDPATGITGRYFFEKDGTAYDVELTSSRADIHTLQQAAAVSGSYTAEIWFRTHGDRDVAFVKLSSGGVSYDTEFFALDENGNYAVVATVGTEESVFLLTVTSSGTATLRKADLMTVEQNVDGEDVRMRIVKDGNTVLGILSVETRRGMQPYAPRTIVERYGSGGYYNAVVEPAPGYSSETYSAEFSEDGSKVTVGHSAY